MYLWDEALVGGTLGKRCGEKAEAGDKTSCHELVQNELWWALLGCQGSWWGKDAELQCVLSGQPQSGNSDRSAGRLRGWRWSFS